jgi:uncharacterized protein (UPF0548 family)
VGKHVNEWKKHQEALARLAELDFNYDEKTYRQTENKFGWNLDSYQGVLGREPAGKPLAEGPFSRAARAVQLYQFPDPNLITAYFDPDQPLGNRNMLMRGRFAGLNFYFGVRVTAVIDEQRKNAAGHQAQAWGYAYRTLQGHFEVGEIRFEVVKDLETGEVSFEVDAYSKPDRIPNIFYRLGFKIFGRSLQAYFAKSSIKRMKEIASGARKVYPAPEAKMKSA